MAGSVANECLHNIQQSLSFIDNFFRN